MLRNTKWFPFVSLFAVAFLAACDNPVDKDDHEDDIVGVEVTTMSGTVLAAYAGGAWQIPGGDALHLHLDEEEEVRIFFLADDGDRFQLPPSGSEHTLRVVIDNPAIVSFEAHPDHGHFKGLAVGETTAEIQVYHGSHTDFETEPLPIEVVDHDH